MANKLKEHYKIKKPSAGGYTGLSYKRPEVRGETYGQDNTKITKYVLSVKSFPALI